MTIYKECTTIFKLAIPLIIGLIGQMLMSLTDTVMIAKLGVTELAALTLANNLFYIPFVFGIGILTCISVQTSIARGAKKPAQARSACRNGFYISLFISILFFVLIYLSRDLLDSLKQDPIVVERSRHFYLIIMASLIPALTGMALKNHADALNHVWTAFWISIASILFNIFLNWVLIYGNLGAPQMNLEGAGFATLIARCSFVIAMFWWFSKDSSLKEWTPFHWFKKPDYAEIKSLTKIGLPSGLQMLTEVGAFVIAGVIIGWFGKEALAAQNIAMVCASIAFMIPLGLSIALTLRVGEKIGLQETTKLRQTYLSGWILTLFFSCVSALVLLTAGKQIASLFIKDAPEVVSIAASFLVVTGIFQIVDGQQVASVGMLRGLKDTTVPAILCFISYWIIALPIGYWLAFHRSMGPVGIWWGLAIGLTISSVFLGRRLWENKGTL